jgi:hypothetical protein
MHLSCENYVIIAVIRNMHQEDAHESKYVNGGRRYRKFCNIASNVKACQNLKVGHDRSLNTLEVNVRYHRAISFDSITS